MEFDLDFVRRIRSVVDEHARRTPLLRSEWLSDQLGKSVFLKCENLQITGSFKLRGAVAALSELGTSAREQGVLTCSTGNHGQGLAYAAARFGVACKVVVPRDAAKNKVDKIRARGATVVEAPGDGYDQALEWMFENSQELGGTYVSAFEGPAILAGNGGTTALEIFEEQPDVDCLVIPTGGGGLICGVGTVARELAPKVKVIGVNPRESAAMWLSRRDDRAYTKLDAAETLADGVEGGVGASNFELAKSLVDDVVCVSEDAIESAMRDVLLREKMVIEGAAALGVAALFEADIPGERIVIVLSGGNLDASKIKRILA
ncbi:MAG: threonine dehydratase [Planctomycetota bacterium]|jgi:threonine dehydratase